MLTQWWAKPNTVLVLLLDAPCFSSAPSHGHHSAKFTRKQIPFLFSSVVAVSYTLDFSCVSTCLFIKWTPEQGLYPSLSPRPMLWATGILLCWAPPLLETSLCTPFRKLPLLTSNMGLWWEQPITIFHPWPQWLVQTCACDSGLANQIASLGFFPIEQEGKNFFVVVHSSTATIPAS